MRVALLAPLFESVPPKLYGGTERVVHNLCQGLIDANVDVTVFASADSVVSGRLAPMVHQALRLSNPPIADGAPYHLKMLAEVGRRAHEFDVIHNHHDYWMLPLSRLVRTPLVTTLHGRLDLDFIGPGFMPFRDSAFVSISDSQRTPLPQLNWQRTVLHGIDVQNFQFHPKPGKYLAFLGRISVEKRPDWAIEIALRAGVPLKIAAKIENGKDREYFDACVKPKIDGRQIEFIGEISESEKSEFLGNALALTFPVDWPEPFGLVMIESLACGTPVLARPCGSVPEILKDGITGFVSPDVNELAKRVRDLPAISRTGCRAWVEKHFSLKRMTEDYLNVYRNLIARSAARDRRNLLHSVELASDRHHKTQLQG